MWGLRLYIQMKPNLTKEEKQSLRKSIVQDILISKVRNNLDSLFDFELTDKEFKENYGATKKEIREII